MSWAAPMPDLVIDAMEDSDWAQVREIYREGITTGDATFETQAPDWGAWDAAHLRSPRLVARAHGAVVAWAALSAVSSRPVYAGVAELSLYVGASARGRGVGRRLLAALVEASERAGFWTLQAGIFPENGASLAVHRACGFRVIGRYERLGRQSDGLWRDVVLLERRSSVVGAERD